MASTKVPSKGLVSLIDLKKRCPRHQAYFFDHFLEKNRKYREQLTKLPEGLPPIDWEYYKRNVRAEAVSMVETFQKKYTSLSIPKPNDTYTPEIEKIKEEVKKEVDEYVKKSNERIAAYQKEMETIKTMLPYSEMTWEDYCILYPKEAPDFINRPTFWPHDPEEQIGYKPPKVSRPPSLAIDQKVDKAVSEQKIKKAEKKTDDKKKDDKKKNDKK